MPHEPKGLNEECGVFDVWGNPNAASITHFGLHTLQRRGQEGAGIVGLTKDRMRRHYGLGLLSKVFTNTDQLTPLIVRAALDHVRYSTAGGCVLENIQPLLFRFSDEAIALAHNGNLTNAISLRRQLEDIKAQFFSLPPIRKF